MIHTADLEIRAAPVRLHYDGSVDFDTRVSIAQGFTNNAQDLEHAIRSTTAGGSTALAWGGATADMASSSR